VVYAVNPLQASRYRERHGVSGGKSDRGDAHMLTDMVRTDSHQLRAVAGDSPDAGAVKVVARTHKTMIWERTRQVQRLRYQLREYFPAAVEAFADLDAPDALELLGKAPDPARARRLTRAQVSAALKRARRRDIPAKATAILAALRSDQLGQPEAVTAAYAVTARSLIAVITVLNEQVKALESQVQAVLAGTRTLRSTGPSPAWDPSSAPGSSANSATTRARHRQNPQELRRHLPAHPRLGEEESCHRPVHPQRPAHRRADGPGLHRPQHLTRRRALYDAERDRGTGHNPALRKVANRLVGILHGCLKTRTLYDEATAWSHHEIKLAA
jgi:hypothetical protein